MCGRYAATLPPEQMMELFKTLNRLDVVPRYNIAPTQPTVAIWEEAGQRKMHFARWGLVPRWVKDPREFPLLVNARAETMADKPAFRDALRHGRCVLPASGYYEWHTSPDRKKQPYYITHADDRPMALAGLYAIWVGPEGEEIDTVVTITVPASAQMAEIHDRMPAILDGEAVEQWLDVRSVRAAEARQLALPLPDNALKFHPVSTRVNTARHDDPDLLRPVTPDKPLQATEEKEAPKNAVGRQLDLF